MGLSVLAASVALLLAGLSAQDTNLSVGAIPKELDGQWPESHAPAGMDFTTIQTSQSKGVAEALIVGGGSWFKWRHPAHTAVLVRHPKGNFLFDTGLGRQVDAQFAVNSWLNRQFFAYDKVTPLIDQLQAQGWNPEAIQNIIPSHMHWDHVSALPDFPNAKVWVSQAERDGAEHGHEPAFLASQFSGVRHWQQLSFDPHPYMGFALSHDFYGDGSVVLVPLAGHTAGQVGMFLNLPSGQHYFFTGDVTWTIEGLRKPADRSWALRQVVHVDRDESVNRAAIVQIHQLMARYPKLTVVPAHDEFVLKTLPHFPAVQN